MKTEEVKKNRALHPTSAKYPKPCHNPKQFWFFETHIRCDTQSQFSDSVADGQYGDLELFSLKLRQQQELEKSLFKANGVVISDSRTFNPDVMMQGSLTDLSG